MTTRTNHGANISLERIDAPPFQLPPPPPGMQWCHSGKWTAAMLSPGTRPLYDGEAVQSGDFTPYLLPDGPWQSVYASVGKIAGKCPLLFRTSRPLVFEHAGKPWTWHRPGDPMPCDGDRFINYLMVVDWPSAGRISTKASVLDWGEQQDPRYGIIGWRYAEPLTKEVELGPEDVPPESVFRPISWKSAKSYITLASVRQMMVCLNCIDLDKTECDQANGSAVSWAVLREMWLINRPRHRDADGKPTLWEKCSKTVTIEQP